MLPNCRMGAWLAPLALNLCGLAVAQEADKDTVVADEAVLYENGRVWNGSGFEQRSLLVVDGRFVSVPEAEMEAVGGIAASQTIDLDGKFVVPPLSDAHNHVTMPADWASNGFLSRGTYYVWNPTTVQLGDGAKAYFARSDTYDVKYSLGGITEPKGHPERLYVESLSERVYGGRKDFLGDAFHYGRNPVEIDAALDLLIEQGADFVKAYLLYSEEYDERRDDDDRYGAKGLNPENVPYLVEAATKRGLKTTFHVETAADLVAAADAGAFAAMHVPGYSGLSDSKTAVLKTLRPDQAERVVASGMLLIPTYLIAANRFGRDESPAGQSLDALVRAIQRHNLDMLRKAGATFLTGTDGFGSVVDELDHLAGLGVFEPIELLNIAFQTGPLLFPDRKICCFDEGCEANFLVLESNPITDLRALEAISERVKGGIKLDM